jgi:molybdenum cofactor cytidylyltransferase
MQLAVVILAAGASSRMGQPKLLLPWGGTSVLGHLVAGWREAGAAQVGVVIAAGNKLLDDELERIGIALNQRIVNPEPARGMFSSIQCAAQWPGWKETITHWAITLGDQPHLAQTTLRSLTGFSAMNPDTICQPSHGKRARHPVVLPRRIWDALASSNQATLKEFLAGHRELTQLVELADPGLDLDIDTPTDYEEALRRFL